MIAAFPRAPLAFTVQRITPVAVTDDGRNFFRVDADLDFSVGTLRPGMRGVAKVDTGRRKLIWVWTHAVVDRLRLWLWSIGL